MAAKKPQLDFNALTVGETIEFETKSGVSLSELHKDGKLETLPFAAVAAFVWLIERRDNSELTFEAMLELDVTEFAKRAEALSKNGTKEGAGASPSSESSS